MIPLGFCIEQGSVVVWDEDSFSCGCDLGPHVFTENEDGTWSPQERPGDAPWFHDQGLRARVYRFARPPAFGAVADYVLEKNAELYRRLAEGPSQ